MVRIQELKCDGPQCTSKQPDMFSESNWYHVERKDKEWDFCSLSCLAGWINQLDKRAQPSTVLPASLVPRCFAEGCTRDRPCTACQQRMYGL